VHAWAAIRDDHEAKELAVDVGVAAGEHSDDEGDQRAVWIASGAQHFIENIRCFNRHPGALV
jgi:hypothetical protein